MTWANRLLTFDDFCFLVKDQQKGDLIDGVIYLTAPDNPQSNRLALWLMGLLDEYSFEKNLGEVFGFRTAFRLSNRNVPEPDLAFVTKSRLALVKTFFIDGPPDVAFEIVNPESRDRDYVKKMRMYQEFCVREYWIVDEIDDVIALFRLNRKGKYQEVRPNDGIYLSEVINGFWLDPKWLWQNPKPKKSLILKQLLAEE
jgi:Uma2 family endonuclease